MRTPRVFVGKPIAGQARMRLDGEATAHLRRVLRLRPGARLIVFDGLGGEYPAQLERYGPDATVVLEAQVARERESPLQVTLCQAMCRGGRMDAVVEKATELGVAVIVPLATERSVVRLDAERSAKRREHWQRVARAACEQCGRNRVPQLAEPIALSAYLETGGPAAALKLVLDLDAARRLSELGAPPREIVLLVGPEGGLAPDELAQARAAGFRSLGLGPRILRTDTAALACLSALQSLWGDA